MLWKLPEARSQLPKHQQSKWHRISLEILEEHVQSSEGKSPAQAASIPAWTTNQVWRWKRNISDLGEFKQFGSCALLSMEPLEDWFYQNRRESWGRRHEAREAGARGKEDPRPNLCDPSRERPVHLRGKRKETPRVVLPQKIKTELLAHLRFSAKMQVIL